MNLLWPILYAIGAAGAFYRGYLVVKNPGGTNTNADWFFITASSIVTFFLPIIWVSLARRRGVRTFRKPSIDRPPFGWWTDTLQPIRVTLIGLACNAIGSVTAISAATDKTRMLIWWFLAMTTSLFIGERVVYRQNAKSIVEASRSEE